MFAALSKAQAEIRDPVKDSHSHKHNFVSITATLNAVRPVLSKHNLAMVQCVDEPVVDGEVTWLPLTTLLLHGSGGYIENIARIPVDMSGGMMNPAQAVGSSITYLRRYAIRSMLALGERDDDGESAYVAAPPPSTTLSDEDQKYVDTVKATLEDGLDEDVDAAAKELTGMLHASQKRGEDVMGHVRAGFMKASKERDLTYDTVAKAFVRDIII